MRVLTETLHGASDLFWEQEEFSVIVSDDSNLTLFTVNLTANYAPALRPPRPA